MEGTSSPLAAVGPSVVLETAETQEQRAPPQGQSVAQRVTAGRSAGNRTSLDRKHSLDSREALVLAVAARLVEADAEDAVAAAEAAAEAAELDVEAAAAAAAEAGQSDLVAIFEQYCTLASANAGSVGIMTISGWRLLLRDCGIARTAAQVRRADLCFTKSVTGRASMGVSAGGDGPLSARAMGISARGEGQPPGTLSPSRVAPSPHAASPHATPSRPSPPTSRGAVATASLGARISPGISAGLASGMAEPSVAEKDLVLETTFVPALARMAVAMATAGRFKPSAGSLDDVDRVVTMLRRKLKGAKRAIVSAAAPELDSQAVADAVQAAQPTLRRLFFHYCEREHGWTIAFPRVLTLAKHFHISPSLLGHGALLRVFRAISPDMAALTYLGFVRVFARAALAGFSQPGLAEEFPEAHQRIAALLDRVHAATERLDAMRMREHRAGKQAAMQLLPRAVLQGREYVERREQGGGHVRGGHGLGMSNLLASSAVYAETGGRVQGGFFGGESILGSVCGRGSILSAVGIAGERAPGALSESGASIDASAAEAYGRFAVHSARQRRSSAVARSAALLAEPTDSEASDSLSGVPTGSARGESADAAGAGALAGRGLDLLELSGDGADAGSPRSASRPYTPTRKPGSPSSAALSRPPRTPKPSWPGDQQLRASPALSPAATPAGRRSPHAGAGIATSRTPFSPAASPEASGDAAPHRRLAGAHVGGFTPIASGRAGSASGRRSRGLSPRDSDTGVTSASAAQSLGATAMSAAAGGLRLTASKPRRRRMSVGSAGPTDARVRAAVIAAATAGPAVASAFPTQQSGAGGTGRSSRHGSGVLVSSAMPHSGASIVSRSDAQSLMSAGVGRRLQASPDGPVAAEADATMSLRSAVHPDAVRHCCAGMAETLGQLRPVFLFYCRVDDPSNAGHLSARGFLRLLRDIGALDEAVHPGSAHLQFVEAARAEAERELNGLGFDGQSRAIQNAGGSARTPSPMSRGMTHLHMGGAKTMASAVRRSATKTARRRSTVRASGAGESLRLEGFLEALVRVSELVREATQGAFRSRGAGALDASAARAEQDAEEAGRLGGHGVAGARERRRREEERERERRRLLGGKPQGSGDAPLTPAERAEALAWARSFVQRRVLPLGTLAAEEDLAVNALAGDGIAVEARRARQMLVLLYGEFAEPSRGPGAGPQLQLQGFQRMLACLEVVPKLVGKRDAEVVFYGAARRGGTDSSSFHGADGAIEASLVAASSARASSPAPQSSAGAGTGGRRDATGSGVDRRESFVVFPYFVEAMCLVALRGYSHAGKLLPTAADRVATLFTWIRACPKLDELKAAARAKGRGFAGRKLGPTDLLGGVRTVQRVKRAGNSSGRRLPSVFAELVRPVTAAQQRADLKSARSMARMVLDADDAASLSILAHEVNSSSEEQAASAWAAVSSPGGLLATVIPEEPDAEEAATEPDASEADGGVAGMFAGAGSAAGGSQRAPPPRGLKPAPPPLDAVAREVPPSARRVALGLANHAASLVESALRSLAASIDPAEDNSGLNPVTEAAEAVADLAERRGVAHETTSVADAAVRRITGSCLAALDSLGDAASLKALLSSVAALIAAAREQAEQEQSGFHAAPPHGADRSVSFQQGGSPLRAAELASSGSGGGSAKRSPLRVGSRRSLSPKRTLSMAPTPQNEPDADQVSSAVGALTMSRSFVVKPGQAAGAGTDPLPLAAGTAGTHSVREMTQSRIEDAKAAADSSGRRVAFSPRLGRFVSFSSPRAGLPPAPKHAEDVKLDGAGPQCAPADDSDQLSFDPARTVARAASAKEHRVRAAAQVYGRLSRERSVRFRADKQADVEEAERELASELGSADSDDEYPGDDVRAVGSDVDAALRRGMSSLNLSSRGGSAGRGASRGGGAGSRMSKDDAARQRRMMRGLAQMRRENEAEAELVTEKESLAVREAQWAIGLREGLRAEGEWGQHAAWRGTVGRHSQGKTVNQPAVPGARGERPKASDATFHVPVIKYEPTYVALPGAATALPASRVPRALQSPGAGGASEDLVHAAHLISPSAAALAAEAAALGMGGSAGARGRKSFFGDASLHDSAAGRRLMAAGATPSAATLVRLLRDGGAFGEEDGSGQGRSSGRIDARAVLEVAAFREEFQSRPVFAPGELQHLHRQAAARRRRATDGWLRSFRADMSRVRWGEHRHDGLPLGAPVSAASATLVAQQQQQQLASGLSDAPRLRPAHLTSPHSPQFAAMKRRGRYRDTWPAEQAEAELEAMDASRHGEQPSLRGAQQLRIAEVVDADGHHEAMHRADLDGRANDSAHRDDRHRREEEDAAAGGGGAMPEHKEAEDAEEEAPHLGGASLPARGAHGLGAFENANARALVQLGGAARLEQSGKQHQPEVQAAPVPSRRGGHRHQQHEDGLVREPSSPESVEEIASRMGADAMAAAMRAMTAEPPARAAVPSDTLSEVAPALDAQDLAPRLEEAAAAAMEAQSPGQAPPPRKSHSPVRISGDFDGLDSHGASAAYEMEP